MNILRRHRVTIQFGRRWLSSLCSFLGQLFEPFLPLPLSGRVNEHISDAELSINMRLKSPMILTMIVLLTFCFPLGMIMAQATEIYLLAIDDTELLKPIQFITNGAIGSLLRIRPSDDFAALYHIWHKENLLHTSSFHSHLPCEPRQDSNHVRLPDVQECLVHHRLCLHYVIPCKCSPSLPFLCLLVSIAVLATQSTSSICQFFQFFSLCRSFWGWQDQR